MPTGSRSMPFASAPFPFGPEVFDFIARHPTVFVVEQNRDAQMRTLLVNEGEVDPAGLVPVLHYDGLPITSTFIADAIRERLARTSRCEERGAKEAAPSPGSRLNGRNASRGTAGPIHGRMS